MSDKFYAKLVEFVETTIRPRTAVVLLCLLTGGVLWDPWDTTTKLGIANDVADYKFYFFMVFVLTAGILITNVVTWIIGRLSKASASINVSLKLKKLSLSKDADVLLHLLYGQRPDYVQMNSRHPAVRELRRNGLVEMGMVISAGDYDDFKLTIKGEKGWASRDMKSVEDIPRNDRLDFYNEVTGQSWHATGPRSWG